MTPEELQAKQEELARLESQAQKMRDDLIARCEWIMEYEGVSFEEALEKTKEKMKIYSDRENRPMPQLPDEELEATGIYVVHSEENEELGRSIRDGCKELNSGARFIINGETLGLGAGPHLTALFYDVYDVYVAVKDIGEAVLTIGGLVALFKNIRIKGLAKKMRFTFEKPGYTLQFSFRKHLSDESADRAFQKMAITQDEFRPRDGVHYVEFEFDQQRGEWTQE